MHNSYQLFHHDRSLLFVSFIGLRLLYVKSSDGLLAREQSRWEYTGVLQWLSEMDQGSLALTHKGGPTDVFT